jgi:hypothetical protein
VGFANLERSQKWVSGYVGDMRTFFPGSARLGYREGKQTMDSLRGKMPYIKLQKKAGLHRDSDTHHSASSTERNRCLQQHLVVLHAGENSELTGQQWH